MSRNNKGFTIIEVAVIMPIVILVIGGLISSIVVMTGDVLASRKAISLQYNIQDALDQIETDTKTSAGFLATNNITLYGNQGYDNNNSSSFQNTDTTKSGPSSTSLILNSYATTNNPANSTRDLVYSKGLNNCDNNLKQQDPPVMLNTIYFVKNNTLWRRVIAPENYISISCNTPWQQPSCYIVGIFCKAKDIKLVAGITEFSISYYNPPYTESDEIANASDSTKDSTARNSALHSNQDIAIQVTISAKGNAAGREFSESGTIQAISPNNYFISN